MTYGETFKVLSLWLIFNVVHKYLSFVYFFVMKESGLKVSHKLSLLLIKLEDRFFGEEILPQSELEVRI